MVVDAIRYVIHNGCVWRAVPADFPPWRTVYGYFARWRDEFAVPTVIDADHLNEVGWWEPNDLGFGIDFAKFPPRPRLAELPAKLGERIRGLYLQIARDLAARFP